jgi:protein TonB
MIRHSSSFFLSLLLHIAILAVVFIIYKGVHHIKKQKEQEKVCVKLCKVVKKIPEVSKEIKKPTLKPKKIESKPKQKKIIKKKPKKILKKKKQYKKHKVKKKRLSPPKPKPKLEPKSEPKQVVKEIVKVEKQEDVYLDIDDDLYDDIEDDIVDDITDINTKEQTIQNLTQKYINNHQDEIRQMINDNLYYPRRARKRGVQGEVKVKFTLSKDAEVSNIIVLSSKSDILSRAAIKTLNNLSKKFPKPDEELVVSIPILYKLR